MKILVIDREPPIYPRHGNALIAMEVFRRLSRHDLTLIAPVAPRDHDRALEELRTTFSEVHLVPRRSWTPAIAGFFESRMAGRVAWLPGTDMRVANTLATTIRSVVRRQHFDVLHVRQLPMAGYRRWAPHVPSLLELVDSETLGAERTLPRSLRTRLRASVAARVETGAVRGFEIITTVAEADATRLRGLAADVRVEVVANGVDAERFSPMAGLERHHATMVFVGAMSYPPNVAAMKHFVTDVLPKIRNRCPDARLIIVGRDPSHEVLALARSPGVEVTGEVEDIRPYLAAATMFVAPMISGSGIKNKVLEALAAACPVVTTPLAVHGLPIRDGQDVVVAESGDAFAMAVIDLLGKPSVREALGRSGRHLVVDGYSWDRCATHYETLYRELARWQGAGA